MILGRNTQQWMGLITSVLGFVGMVIGLVFPTVVGPATIIINGLVGVAGIFISFVANTHTTPINDARIPVGTVMSATDPETGMVLGHVQVPKPEAPPVVEDLGEPAEEDDAFDEGFEEDPGEVEEPRGGDVA